MEQPSISVVIPCHDRIDELRRAVESVLNQTTAPYELIICDDGSLLDLSVVSTEFDTCIPVKYMRIERSGGPARPRNLAASAARGQWLALLDSDDVWYADKLSVLMEHIGDEDIYYHRLKKVGRNGALSRAFSGASLGRGRAVNESDIYNFLSLGNPIPLSSTIIRRRIYQDLGGMSETSAVEDYEFWVRAAAAGARFKFVDRILGEYQVTNDARSTRYLAVAASLQHLFEKYEPTFEGASRADVRAYKHFCVGVQLLRAGDRAEGVRHLRLAGGLRIWRHRLSRSIKLTGLKLI